MKRLLIFLLFASPAFAQTHTFPALDTNNAFTGSNTFGTFNNVLFVDGTQFATCVAAITAAGVTNNVIIVIPSTYAGADCPTVGGTISENIVIWDFRGVTHQLVNNTLTYNTNNGGLKARMWLSSVFSNPTTQTGLGFEGQTYTTGTLATGNGVEGGSFAVNTFGAITTPGTFNIAPMEFDLTMASTGGTITNAYGLTMFLASRIGNTTNITNVFGINLPDYSKVGSETITNDVGIFVPARSAGSTVNWSIQAGPSIFDSFQFNTVGSKTAPTLQFTGEQTGFYHQGTNAWGFTAGGVNQFLELANLRRVVSTHVYAWSSGDPTVAVGDTAISRCSANTLCVGANEVSGNSGGSLKLTGLLPASAGLTSFLCTAALPCGDLFLGTAATNNFRFLPAATAAARTVSIPDPLTNVNLAFNLTATSAAFATATTAATCVQNTTAVAGAATTMVAEASPVSTPGVGAVWAAFVSSAGNVTITECAVAASAGGSIAFNIRVHP